MINNCEKCGFSYKRNNRTNPCSKCKGNTQVVKNPPNSFYSYAEKCLKCGHECQLGISLEFNQEEHSCQIPVTRKSSLKEKLLGLLHFRWIKKVPLEGKGFCALCIYKKKTY